MTIGYQHEEWARSGGPKRSGSPGMEITGRHVLFAMLGFFGVIFAVNGVFLYNAIGTYTGVVQDEPYRKGLAYNERIAEDARQTALGWVRAVSLTDAGMVKLTLADKAGAPVRGLVVDAVVGRPSTNVSDVPVRLIEGVPGHYQANIGAIAAGRWLISIEARRADGERAGEVIYRAKERIWLTPS